MSKHTPGPWQNIASMPSEGFDCWWLSANGMAIATISGYQGDPECAANARLIAAAPDLLEASPRAVEMLRIAADVIRHQAPRAHYKYDGADCDGYCIADDCESAAEDLSAAIAKAEEPDHASR